MSSRLCAYDYVVFLWVCLFFGGFPRGCHPDPRQIRLGSPSLVWDNMDQMMFGELSLDPKSHPLRSGKTWESLHFTIKVQPRKLFHVSFRGCKFYHQSDQSVCSLTCWKKHPSFGGFEKKTPKVSTSRFFKRWKCPCFTLGMSPTLPTVRKKKPRHRMTSSVPRRSEGLLYTPPKTHSQKLPKKWWEKGDSRPLQFAFPFIGKFGFNFLEGWRAS